MKGKVQKKNLMIGMPGFSFEFRRTPVIPTGYKRSVEEGYCMHYIFFKSLNVLTSYVSSLSIYLEVGIIKSRSKTLKKRSLKI